MAHGARPDPNSLLGLSAGINQYAFAADDPINASDPSGAMATDQDGSVCTINGDSCGEALAGGPGGGIGGTDGGFGPGDGSIGARITAAAQAKIRGWIDALGDFGNELKQKLADYSLKIGIYGTIGVGTGGLGDAAAGLEFASGSLLEQHFIDHGAEVAAESAPEYLSAARTFFGRKDLMTIIRSNGDRVFYSSSTNEFGVVGETGNIRTYFKPVGDGLAYFFKQYW